MGLRSPLTPLSGRREAGAELQAKFATCQTELKLRGGNSGLGRPAVGNFLGDCLTEFPSGCRNQTMV